VSRQIAGGRSTKRSISAFGSGLAPQPRARRHETRPPARAFDQDGAEIIVGVVDARILRRCAGFDEVKAALRHVLGGSDPGGTTTTAGQIIDIIKK
jgi:hypothetical protein